MGLKNKLLRGGVVLSVGYAVQQLLLFVRNVIIARLVGPDDFGIQVTFLVFVSALEMVSDLGVELYLIRAPNGDEPIVENTLHTVLLIRGLVLGLAIYLAADFVAQFFNVREVAWAYRVLAAIPVIKGFLHLDVRRMQRHMVFYPTIVTLLAGTIAATAVAVVLAYFLHNYQAMLWAYIVDAAVMVATSHIVAKRKYKFEKSRQELKSLLNYGWPLLLNGAVLFLMGQGDRSIIGSQLGVRDLANYAVAGLLTGGPALLIIKVSGALFLPLLSGGSGSGPAFASRYDWCGALTALAAIPVVVLLSMYGQPLATLLYSDKYDVSAFVMAWLAVTAGARILRSWPQAAALATGRTQDVLIGNALPMFGFFLALISLRFDYGAVGVAACIAAGEVIALLFALERSDRATSEGFHQGRKYGALFMLLAAMSLAAISLFPPSMTSAPLFFLAMGIMLLAVGGVVFISRSIWSMFMASANISGLRGT